MLSVMSGWWDCIGDMQSTAVTALKSDRKIKLAETRLKFERATSELAAEQRFGDLGEVQSELQISQEATRLTKEADKSRR